MNKPCMVKGCDAIAEHERRGLTFCAEHAETIEPEEAEHDVYERKGTCRVFGAPVVHDLLRPLGLRFDWDEAERLLKQGGRPSR